MSWIKRRGQGASPNPSSAPPVQMYNPNQHSNLQVSRFQLFIRFLISTLVWHMATECVSLDRIIDRLSRIMNYLNK